MDAQPSIKINSMSAQPSIKIKFMGAQPSIKNIIWVHNLQPTQISRGRNLNQNKLHECATSIKVKFMGAQSQSK